MTCASLESGYGGCKGAVDCGACCSKSCHCVDLEEKKSECVCGKKNLNRSIIIIEFENFTNSYLLFLLIILLLLILVMLW